MSVKCRNCVNLCADWCDMKADSPDPDMERECHWFAQMTNADRIRAMTDEELADFMVGVAQNGGVPTGGKIMRWIDWLKQECVDG